MLYDFKNLYLVLDKISDLSAFIDFIQKAKINLKNLTVFRKNIPSLIFENFSFFLKQRTI